MFSEKRPWTLGVLLLLLVSAAVFTNSALAAPTTGNTDLAALDQPISIKIEEAVSVFAVYRSFGKGLGVNVLFDPAMKDTKVTFSIDEMSGRDGLALACELFGHFYKVVDENTILVADDTPQNRRQFEEQAIATFYLENAEVKDAMTMLRSLLGAKNIAAIEGLNAITLRDRLEVVELARELVRRMDVPNAEVAVEVEVLEIASSDIEELRQDGQSTMRLSFDELEQIRSVGSARRLARPQLVAQSGDRARVNLGDRTPIRTGEDVTYQDVGLALQVRPQVHPTTHEVTLDMELELSRLADGETSKATPVVTSRSFESSFRLADGEVILFSGLPAPDKAANGREILVAVSADLVHLPDAASRQEQVVRIGTEMNIELRGEPPAKPDDGQAASAEPLDAASKEVIRERLRQRLREKKENDG